VPLADLAAATADLSWFARLERDVMHAITCTWHGPFLHTVCKAVESKVVPVILLVLALAWVARKDPRRALRGLFAAGVGVGVGLLVAELMWLTIARPRPQRVYETLLRTEAELATCAAHPEALAFRSDGSTRPGFPSQHGVTVGVFVTALWLVRRRLGLLAAVYGLAVCVERLHSGKHWPSDVVAGVTLGAAVGWLAWRVYPPVARRLGLPAAADPPPPRPAQAPDPGAPGAPTPESAAFRDAGPGSGALPG
jgi:membrane-associated phospholipid phosphatase